MTAGTFSRHVQICFDVSIRETLRRTRGPHQKKCNRNPSLYLKRHHPVYCLGAVFFFSFFFFMGFYQLIRK